jgi:hypothetical protein
VRGNCSKIIRFVAPKCHNVPELPAQHEEKSMIRYMGTRKNMEGATVYVFVINGLQKEVRESALKQHPGCFEALPASAKAKIAANRSWMSKL